ncbi:MAG: S8 family serine peptidase [Bacteroidetes bacterium]|nr:S8 family serine peptidase [Bacteroidota bacterium]
MKNSLPISLIVLIAFVFGIQSQSQVASPKIKSGHGAVRASLDSASLSAQWVPGMITVKLKKGVGEFGKQTGNVSFGIPSLDLKVANYQVNQLEKRFRYNPAKYHEGLPDLSRIYKISFPENLSLTEVAAIFSSDPNVEYAEPIPVIHAFDVPNNSLYSQLQHLPQIFGPEAWAIHKGENGLTKIVIAINDSGIDWDHVDLQSNIWQNLAEDADHDGHTMELSGTSWVLDPGDLNGIDNDGNGHIDDLIGWNFIGNNGDPNPYQGNPMYSHGTHCAGIADGATNNDKGLASISWNVKVMPICVDQNNSYPYAYDGIIYAAESGADIISNSWGGGGYSLADQETITYAAGLGSIVLAAAGNNNVST